MFVHASHHPTGKPRTATRKQKYAPPPQPNPESPASEHMVGIDVTAVGALITEAGYHLPLKHLNVKFVYEPAFVLYGDACTLTLHSDSYAALENAAEEVQSIVHDPVGFKASLKKEIIHVFVDDSNFMFGGIRRQQLRAPSGNGIWLDNYALLRRLQMGRWSERLFACGSGHHGADRWQRYRRCGYETQVHTRQNGKEHGVDDTLHAEILCDVKKCHDTPHTLVLLTGDGNRENEDKCSFPAVVKVAIRNGWNVEVWAWCHSTSGAWQDLVRTHSSQFSLNYLDDYASEILRPRIGCARQQRETQSAETWTYVAKRRKRSSTSVKKQLGLYT
jgi:hypothetical protein